MTKAGFIISGFTNAEISLTVNGTSTTGHYFTVPTPFTFWDNNTIRLGEHDDIAEAQPSILHNFTLEYIENYITEPTSTTGTKWCDVNATGANNGTSEADAYTSFSTAFNSLQAGQTLYVKAGLYNETVRGNLTKTSTASQPIRIIGYKTDYTANGGLGDITSNYYTYTPGQIAPDLSSVEMPVIQNTDALPIWANVSNYMIFRNIQVQNTENGWYIAPTSTNIKVINCNTKNTTGSAFQSLYTQANNVSNGNLFPNNKISFVGCVAANPSTSSGGGFVQQASQGLVKDCKVYMDTSQANGDYFINTSGDNSIIIGCRAESLQTVDGHGIHVRGMTNIDNNINTIYAPSRWNLIKDSYIKMGGTHGLGARNYNSNYNVFKDCTVEGFKAVSDEYAVFASTGAQNNTFERIYINGVRAGINLTVGTESAPELVQNTVKGNKFNNLILNDVSYIFQTSTLETYVDGSAYEDNEVNHLTAYNALGLMEGDNATNNEMTFSNNVVKNSIIHTVTNENRNADKPQFAEMWTVENSNFYNNGAWDTAYIGVDGNIDVDPVFVDTVDFVPQTTMSVSTVVGTYYDYNGDERDATTTTIGAQRIEND